MSSRAFGSGRSHAAGFAGIGAIGVLLALALAFAPAAAASGHGNRPFASLPHLGPAPVRCELGTDPNCPEFTDGTNFTVESSCGSISISPHVVNVAQNVTATMAETARKCRIQWGSPPGKLVAGCKDGDYKVINPQKVETVVPPSSTCVWKATSASSYPPDAKAPGGGWNQFEVGFCAFVGCAALASDYYYVLPHKKAISGTVYSGATDANGNRLGVGGVVIKLSGQSSGTAVTNKDGFYDALVDPGRYTVHMQSVGGQSATGSPVTCSPGRASRSDCKLDVGGSDGVADFNSCGASGPARDVASAAASSAGSCPLLKVTITFFQSHKAGVGFFLGRAFGFDTPLPEFLVASSTDHSQVKCVSGCMNVRVTVTDKRTGEKVKSADVTASVTGFPPGGIAPYPNGSGSGDGHLCGPGLHDFATCGGHELPGRPITDGNGRVDFLYWAPGAISQHTVKITAKAQIKCNDPNVCRAGMEKGENTRSLTISRNVIYHDEGRLSPEGVDVVKEWAHDDGDTGKFRQALNFSTEQALEKAISGIVEFYAEHAVPLVVAAEAAHKIFTAPREFAEIRSAIGQEEALTALLVTPLKLATVGIGSAKAAEFDPALIEAIAGRDGLLRRYGIALERAHGHITDQRISVRMVEVSYCPENAECGPGTGAPGINQFVDINFRSDTPRSSLNSPATVFEDNVVLPYSAADYTDVQYNGKLPPK